MKLKSTGDKKKAFQALVLFVFTFFTATLWAQESEITIATEEWAPYNYTENGVLKGSSVEIVQNIIDDLQANAQIRVYPNMRTTQILNGTSRAMMITMFRTPEREEKYNWIGPLAEGAIYFYKKKGDPLVISTLEDAKKVKTIATRHAGLVFSTMKAAGFTNMDSTANDGISIYKKLLTGRCDLAISDSPLGVKYLLKQLNYSPDALVQTAVSIVDSQLYIATSKDIPPNEIARWQESLDKMKASGVYDQILKKYGG